MLVRLLETSMLVFKKRTTSSHRDSRGCEPMRSP